MRSTAPVRRFESVAKNSSQLRMKVDDYYRDYNIDMNIDVEGDVRSFYLNLLD